MVLRMLALKDDNLLHLLDKAFISSIDGKVFFMTPERGFCTCDRWSASLRNGVSERVTRYVDPADCVINI